MELDRARHHTCLQLGQSGIANYVADVDAGGRTGRHVVFTVWQGHWVDQIYFSCSDVIFPAAAQQPRRSAQDRVLSQADDTVR